MKSPLPPLLAAGLLAAAALPARATIERTLERSFPVSDAGTLSVATEGGTITVESSPDPVVRITVRERIRAGSEADADQVLGGLQLTLSQEGNDVTARAEYPRPALNFAFGDWPPVQVSFVVSVPARFSADLRTSGGSITVGDLAGRLRARTSGGEIRLGRVGGAVDASTSGGGISLVEGRDSVSLETSGGPIAVGRVVGPATLRTSGGGIRVGSAENTLQASSSGGSVQASLRGPVRGDCELRTSGGEVTVKVDAQAAFNLRASTSGGRVEVRNLSFAEADSNRERSRLSGSVNGGGPLLALHSSGGNITVAAQ